MAETQPTETTANDQYVPLSQLYAHAQPQQAGPTVISDTKSDLTPLYVLIGIVIFLLVRK